MAALRNLRHERFAREYVKTGCGAEAYRRVYPRAKPLTSARANASRLLTYDNVSRRTSELREAMIKRSDITMEKILNDYQWVIDNAKADRKHGDVKAASEAQAKLVGMLRDRVEAGNVGDFDALENIGEVLEKVAKDISPSVAKALAEALQLEIVDDDTELHQAIPPTDAVN